MKRFTLFVLLLGLAASTTNAQDLLRPFYTISHKKPTYLTMKKGKEVEGTVKKIDRKKGLIEEIKIKTTDGKKKTIPVTDMKSAYLPQSGWDKMGKLDNFLSDATQWDKGLHDMDRIKKGYAFFETAKVLVKKKTRTLLMQLLNPGTCSRIKVYHDPFAKETASLGVGGVKVAGGLAKSYYISKDGKTAFRIFKKTYKEDFNKLFGDCDVVKKKYQDKKWNEFVEAVFAYNAECAK